MSVQVARRVPRGLSAKELVDRLQEMVDSRPTEGNCPIEWAVPAYFLGDLGPLAALSLRSGSSCSPEPEARGFRS
jgi:hypothetical protein